MSTPVVSIIDYGVGNLNSVANMIRRAGADVRFITTPAEVEDASHIVLPGVGAFDTCRAALGEIDGLETAIRNAVQRNAELLGICVGMQLLANSSEEGKLPGLGLVPGTVRRFRFQGEAAGTPLRVPHMAWCQVVPQANAKLFAGELSNLNRFYFVHSYHFECADPNDIAGSSEYGIRFSSAIQRDRVYGVQFHPEKSHRYGLALFRNFIELP